MLYLQQFRNSRQNQLNDIQQQRIGTEHKFLLCSNEYAEKVSHTTRSKIRPTTPSISNVRSRTLLILTPLHSLVSLNNTNNDDTSVLNIVSEKSI